MERGKYQGVPKYLLDDVVSEEQEVKKSKNMFDKSGPWYKRKASQLRQVTEDIKRILGSPE